MPRLTVYKTAQIYPDAHLKLVSLVKDDGVSQVGVVSRLVKWFAALDASERELVMQRLNPNDEPVVAELVLRRHWHLPADVDLKSAVMTGLAARATATAVSPTQAETEDEAAEAEAAGLNKTAAEPARRVRKRKKPARRRA